jgi:hypothetical protein
LVANAVQQRETLDGRVDLPSGRPKASTLGVSRATVYRVLVKSGDE